MYRSRCVWPFAHTCRRGERQDIIRAARVFTLSSADLGAIIDRRGHGGPSSSAQNRATKLVDCLMRTLNGAHRPLARSRRGVTPRLACSRGLPWASAPSFRWISRRTSYKRLLIAVAASAGSVAGLSDCNSARRRRVLRAAVPASDLRVAGGFSSAGEWLHFFDRTGAGRLAQSRPGWSRRPS